MLHYTSELFTLAFNPYFIWLGSSCWWQLDLPASLTQLFLHISIKLQRTVYVSQWVCYKLKVQKRSNAYNVHLYHLLTKATPP